MIELTIFGHFNYILNRNGRKIYKNASTVTPPETVMLKREKPRCEEGLLVASARLRRGREAVLVLEDGSVFRGYGFGASRKVSGEVVFSTSMVGYPEALTDPSYRGQILTLTYPLIGNYGVPPKKAEFGVPLYFESESIKVKGLAIYDLCEKPYHWASTKSLEAWLTEEEIPGIFGVDTRQLAEKLRDNGVMLGILEACEIGAKPDIEKLKREVKSIPGLNLRDLVKEVTIDKPILYGDGGKETIILIDCGVRYSILRDLLKRRVDVVRVPYDFSAGEVLEYKPKGIVISNGPGDPNKCKKTVECVQELLAQNIPILGICLGADILALASGGKTYKLKYGHRSQNQPVVDLETGRCYITEQNHGYTVDFGSLKGKDLKVRFINANDKTVEGLKHTSRSVLALQWYPTNDTEFLLDEFMKRLR